MPYHPKPRVLRESVAIFLEVWLKSINNFGVDTHCCLYKGEALPEY